MTQRVAIPAIPVAAPRECILMAAPRSEAVAILSNTPVLFLCQFPAAVSDTSYRAWFCQPGAIWQRPDITGRGTVDNGPRTRFGEIVISGRGRTADFIRLRRMQMRETQ